MIGSYVCQRVKSIVEKGENAPFPTTSKKARTCFKIACNSVNMQMLQSVDRLPHSAAFWRTKDV